MTLSLIDNRAHDVADLACWTVHLAESYTLKEETIFLDDAKDVY